MTIFVRCQYSRYYNIQFLTKRIRGMKHQEESDAPSIYIPSVHNINNEHTIIAQ